jgi:aryl-alcohol dehydrogenase-like predicted oxidoreductase
VQNRYNLADRSSETLLDYAEANGTGSSRGTRWLPAISL